MKTVDITNGECAAKWGLTDFYKESEQKLTEALAGEDNFTTGWWGCKKEIRYARITREGSSVLVEVSAHMDDIWDDEALIYDALWDECGVEEELPEDIVDSIRDAVVYDVDDHTEVFKTIESNKLSDIVEALGKLEAEAEENNERMYKILRRVVAEHYDYLKSLEVEA